MNKNEKALVDILSSAIRGQKVKDLEVDKIDWDIVLHEAKAHDVHSLLYIALKEWTFNSDSGVRFISYLKQISMATVTKQTQNIHNISEILLTLKESGITVIALKGIVLKDMYPYPELRTMGDVDLLIPIKYIDSSKNILKQLGYKEMSADPKHIMLTHSSLITFELHITLLSKEKQKTKKEEFDKQLWKNIIPATVCGVEIYSLGCIDQLLHICLHMISHILNKGFGLRHLCDFVLYTEYIFDIIDWQEFCTKSQELEIDYFVAAIFEVSHQLFELKIPTLVIKYKFDQKTIDSLIVDILKSGTFGHRTINWKYRDEVLDEISSERTGSLLKPKGIMKAISTRSQRVLEKCGYARKYSFLMPIAWVHYLTDRTYYLILSSIAAKRRTKLFNNLKLK